MTVNSEKEEKKMDLHDQSKGGVAEKRNAVKPEWRLKSFQWWLKKLSVLDQGQCPEKTATAGPV